MKQKKQTMFTQKICHSYKHVKEKQYNESVFLFLFLLLVVVAILSSYSPISYLALQIKIMTEQS